VWCFSLWFLVWTYCLISGNWNDGSWSVPSVSLRLLSVLGFKSTLIFLRLHTKNWNISTNLILSNSLYYCFLCMIKLKWSLLLWNMWLKALTTLVYLIFHSCHFGSLSSVIPFFSVLAYRLLMETKRVFVEEAKNTEWWSSTILFYFPNFVGWLGNQKGEHDQMLLQAYW
jgi:hypothetical protein